MKQQTSKLVKTQNGSTFAVQVQEGEKQEMPVVTFRSMDTDGQKPLCYEVRELMGVVEKPLVLEGLVKTKIDWKQVQVLQNWVKQQIEKVMRYA